MKYTKTQIGHELLDILNMGYDIHKISNWADAISINLNSKESQELDDILQRILIMDAGPEFEYTENELRLIAKKLILNENNPIKRITEINSNGVKNKSEFSKKQIGNLLADELLKGYDIKRLAKWAQEMYYKVKDKASPEIVNLLEMILLIDAGEDLSYSERELWALAKMLINEEEDPLKKLNDLKARECE